MKQKLPTINSFKKPELTDREKEVLFHLIEGLNNREIADKMVLSVNTVKAHVSNILNKLEVNCRVKAAVKAVKLQII